GTPGNATLCTTGAAIDLFAELGGTPDAGGTWSGPSAVVGGSFDPATMTAGIYTYTITVPPPCASVSSTVTIALVQPPDAGTDGTLTLCISSPAVTLLSSLGGTPDIGGAWSGPSAVIGGSFNPANMDPGVYTYTVAGAAPCPADASEVTVAVVDEPDAGSPGSRTLCTSDASIDLFAELNGTPDVGGAWSGPSAVVGGQFDPGSMAAGVYTYTITVPPPCASVSSTVTMALSQPPDAGQDASLTLCVSSPSTAMFPALSGSPNAGGTWSGPSPVVGGQFNPASMSAGVYTYTVPGVVPCPATSATLTIDVVAAPDAGAPGLITLCATDDAIDLFEELNGTPDAGGNWSGPSAVIGGAFDPVTMSAGVYTYTIVVPPPCVNATSSVTVSIVQPPDAGEDGSLTLCVSSPSVALVASLGGSPDAGGAWSGPSTVLGGNFNPSNMVSGPYVYTVNGTAPCPADAATVDVTVVASPDPGGPGFLTACASDAPTDLFTLIEGSPDAGGTWNAPNGTAVSGIFDPATDVPGVYTYTITVPPPCASVSTTVTVDVIQPSVAGVDASLTLCISSPVSPLFPLLGPTAEPAGTWSGPLGAASGDFDPATDQAGDYHYTVAGVWPCPADIATVTVAVVATPDPGTDGSATLCANNASIDLFSVLNGTPDAGGVWTAPNGTAFPGPLDPSTDASGVYTYTIDAPPPCSSVSATVDVSIIQPPDAGTNGMITVCATGAAVDLFNVLQGSPDVGGSWTNSVNAPWSGTFDPTVDAAGTFTYRVEGTTPCAAAMANVTVSVTQEPNAGDDAILNLCIAGSPIDVFPSLGGASPGGIWTGPGGTPFDGTFTPGTSPSGDYVYTVAGTAPCPSASATVTVNQLSDPDAGGDGTMTLCSSHGPFDPYTALQGSPDAGGTWIAPNGVPVTEALDASTALSGTYTYVLSVPPPCVNDTALMMISIVPAVDAGSDGEITLCSNSGTVDLFDTLGGEPDPGGTWAGPNGAVSGVFNPGQDTPGNYTYSLQGTAPCPNVSAIVTVSVEALPNAGTDGSLTVCPEAPNVDLFSLLGGEPDQGGSWTAPDGSPCDPTFDPGVDPVGNYTYTVFGVTACPDASASSTVSIHVVPTPNAGPDQVVCSLTAEFNATGTWASGSWSGPSSVLIGEPSSATSPAKAEAGGVYTFVWNVLTSNGCAARDTVNIIFTDPIEPISQVTDAICNGSCDGTATVTATGGNIGATGYTYQWSNALAGNVPFAEGICAGSYTVAVVDTNGCSAPSPFTIGEPTPLVIDAITTTSETCPGSCDGTLTVSDAEGVSFSIGAEQQANNVFASLCGGSYSVTMMDANGCTAHSIGLVDSPPPVIANFVFAPDTVFVDDPTVYFGNASSPNAFSFAWDLGGLASSTESSPTFRFPDDEGSIYTVCLTAYDLNGCSNEICLPIQVFDLLLVSVPNAFSPNGDGINDDFLPVFNLPWVVDYKFMVFNRWGEQIFGTDLPGKPWKGDYTGVVSQEDVYVWKLSCKDGLSGDPIERVGHVTLLK
ncbi:MAG: gliding motility-associated C-terminal domain-containing protein, partial [Flavobacteriales bacterium]|nr:gliding motility-associated C-terminal domain-containing protein [Flavobacteriales bacterium]